MKTLYIHKIFSGHDESKMVFSFTATECNAYFSHHDRPIGHAKDKRTLYRRARKLSFELIDTNQHKGE